MTPLRNKLDPPSSPTDVDFRPHPSVESKVNKLSNDVLDLVFNVKHTILNSLVP